jgi:hypothetical protein
MEKARCRWGCDPDFTKGAETVLLVGDEPSMPDFTKQIPGRQGYTVLSASAPEEAIGIAWEHPGEIHLLLTEACG